MKNSELPYHVIVFYSEDDEGYIALAPDLKGCSAFGETPDEALKEVKTAMFLWIEECQRQKRPLPRPTKIAA